MRILVLEDRQDNIDNFVKNLPKNHEVHYVKTPTDAIWKLSDLSFDVIFLDHDLPDTHQQKSYDTFPQ
jgi:CheY-like chemotaxis protein